MFSQEGTGRDNRLTYRWESEWDASARLCTIRMRFVWQTESGTRVFHETHRQRGYTLDEITGGLERAGFREVTAYEAFTLRPISGRTDRYYLFARRPGGG